MKWMLMAVSIFWLFTAAHADDSAMFEVAGTVAPMGSHPTVRMLREKVDIKLGLFSAKVRCEFVFKNEGSATTVKMGFPEVGYEYHPELQQSKQTEKRTQTHFESWVDGKPVKTTFTYSTGDEYGEYQAWTVKEVKFDKGQTRTVVNKYEGRVSPFWEESFRYVLSTGRNWKDKIGKAIITVDTSELQRYWRVIPRTPKGAVTKGSSINWVLKDFEPEQDVVLEIERKQRIFIGDPADAVMVNDFDFEVYHERGITMAPIKYLDIDRLSASGRLNDAKSMGDWPPGVPKALAHVAWNSARRECTVSYQGHTLVLRPGQKTAMLDGSKKIKLPEKPYIMTVGFPSDFYVPILAVAKAVGIKIGYDPKTGDTSLLDRK